MISTPTTNEERDCKSELDENKVWKPREATLLQSNKIYSSIMGEIMEDMDESSRTKLDSHINMPVIGKNAFVLSKNGETVDVAPFTPDYNPIRVELVDAELKYDCSYSGESKILIIRRGLYDPSMSNNLLPPFMLREDGININEVPKIHVSSPTEDHHSIMFQETNF